MAVHVAGKPINNQIEEATDIWIFSMNQFGMRVRFDKGLANHIFELLSSTRQLIKYEIH
jgi:hypothetical protein